MRCFKGQARTGIFEPWHGIPPLPPCFQLALSARPWARWARWVQGTGPTLGEGAPDRRCHRVTSLLSLGRWLAGFGGLKCHPIPLRFLAPHCGQNECIKPVLNQRFLAKYIKILYIRGKFFVIWDRMALQKAKSWVTLTLQRTFSPCSAQWAKSALVVTRSWIGSNRQGPTSGGKLAYCGCSEISQLYAIHLYGILLTSFLWTTRQHSWAANILRGCRWQSCSCCGHHCRWYHTCTKQV